MYIKKQYVSLYKNEQGLVEKNNVIFGGEI